MSMSGWLEKRLPRIKRLSQKWAVLAQTLEAVWEEFFDPAFTRLENMRSGYLMDKEDLAVKMRELGDVLIWEIESENRPVSVAWRHLELTYKEQKDILNIAIKRVLGHTDIEMCPYFAPTDKAYGTEFKIYRDFEPIDESKREIPPDGYFLTSRMLFRLSWDDFVNRGYTAELFLDNIFPLIQRFKPLHIVCNIITTVTTKNDFYVYYASSAVSKTSAQICLMSPDTADIPMTGYFAVLSPVAKTSAAIYIGEYIPPEKDTGETETE